MNKKDDVINCILQKMQPELNEVQLELLKSALYITLHTYEITTLETAVSIHDNFNEYIVKQYFAMLYIEGKSPKTIERYKLILKMMLESIQKNVKDITTNDLRYFLAMYQEKRKVSGTTLDGMRRVLTAFFNWLELEDHIYKSPARRINRVKKDTIQEPELKESEMELMAMACTNDRDRAILEFLYSTAARVSEVSRANISDVDFRNKSIVLHGKGGKERITFFTDKALLFLERYLSSRNDNEEALFLNLKKPYNRITKDGIENIIKKLGTKAQVTGAHPHRFRVTRITILVNRGMPLQYVQEIAGHSDINTTRMYYRSNNERVRYEYMKSA